MENKINIAELLKDCPQGMELDCLIFEDVTLYGIDTATENEYPIRIVTNGYFLDLTKYGTYSNIAEAKCVIFPKGKTTWEGFQRPFKDGDIVITKTINNFIFYSIYKGVKNREVLTYADYTPDDNELINVNHTLCYSCEIIEQRFATEEEKQKLFNAIKANGYKWNPETKTFEKLIDPKFKVGDKIEKCGYRFTIVEIKDNYYLTKCGNKIPIDNQDDFSLVPNKFDITTLKPFDKVLVREKNTEEWRGHFFSHYDSNSDRPYVCIGVEGINEYKQCIPYEGNEHLLGTTNDCDEYYKTW